MTEDVTKTPEFQKHLEQARSQAAGHASIHPVVAKPEVTPENPPDDPAMPAHPEGHLRHPGRTHDQRHMPQDMHPGHQHADMHPVSDVEDLPADEAPGPGHGFPKRNRKKEDE